MKSRPDQLELAGAAFIFNLAQETTQDGAALILDIARREQDRKEAESRQKPLFEPSPEKLGP